MISSGGFPFDIGDEDTAKKSKQQAKNDAIFPCDVGIGWSLACKGEISCSTPDISLCCGGLVYGYVSGSGSFDCADDFYGCTGSLAISGGINVGIPNCNWCPDLLEFGVTYARSFGVQSCCSGPFAYTMDSISLSGTFLVVVRAELSGTFYQMATKNDNACKTARPNYIQNALRDMVIEGKIEICFLFCFSIVSGNIFMLPGPSTVPINHAKRSGDCCVWVNAWASRHSCEYCPSGNKFTWVWNCGGSRKCK